MRSYVYTRSIPYLHLRRTTQVNTGIRFRTGRIKHPVHIHFKITVLFFRAQIVTLAIEYQHTVFHAPAFTHDLIGFRLLFGQLSRFHLRTGNRILYQTFPAGQILTVKQRNESFALRHLGQMFLDRFFLIAGIRIVKHLHYLIQQSTDICPHILLITQSNIHDCIGGSLLYRFLIQKFTGIQHTQECSGFFNLL
ncbi:unknown [Parabacteroides merdae CAG:48]|nr:unknown [Parabacteroides merdae CAG:48]